jgi:hypothetical protein
MTQALVLLIVLRLVQKLDQLLLLFKTMWCVQLFECVHVYERQRVCVRVRVVLCEAVSRLGWVFLCTREKVGGGMQYVCVHAPR